MLKSLLMPIVTEKERQCNELRLLFDDEIISKVHGIENIDYTLKKAAVAEFNQNYYHYMLKGKNHDIVVQQIGRIIQVLGGFERSVPSVSTPPTKGRLTKGRLCLHMDAALSEFNDSVAAVMKSLADFEIGIETSAEKMRFQLGGLKISLSKDGGGDNANTGQDSKVEDLREMKKAASEAEDDSVAQTVSSEKTDQHSLSSPSTSSDPSIDARSAVSKQTYNLETSSTASDPSIDSRSVSKRTNNLGSGRRSMLRLRRNIKGSEEGNTTPPQKIMHPRILVVYPGPLGIKVKIDKEYDGGAVIKSIDQDSPLKGVEVGDRIVEIDGRKVTSNSDFRVNKGKKRRFKVVKANVQM